MDLAETKLPDVGQIIHREHQDLYAVLTCLRLMARKSKDEARPLNAAAIRQAFDYMETVLNAFHHPKEDEYLFPVLRVRCPDLGAIIDELETQHRQMPGMLEQMRDALSRYEAAPETERDAMCDAIEACCKREIGHMKLEESKILKQARTSLSGADWATIDAAFADNANPLFGDEKDAAYTALYQDLLAAMPAPYGYGESA